MYLFARLCIEGLLNVTVNSVELGSRQKTKLGPRLAYNLP